MPVAVFDTVTEIPDAGLKISPSGGCLGTAGQARLRASDRACWATTQSGTARKPCYRWIGMETRRPSVSTIRFDRARASVDCLARRRPAFGSAFSPATARRRVVAVAVRLGIDGWRGGACRRATKAEAVENALAGTRAHRS